MKIEIVESLCYSYLRHVKNCWLVQSNWKGSEHWRKQKSDRELDALFVAMRRDFDPHGKVFKKTESAAQLIKQGEIDVLGVDQDGAVHAIETAFHENGLNYGGGPANRVLKKLLRTVVVLQAYLMPGTRSHVYFASPKVNPGVRRPLQAAFAALRNHYPAITWSLFINADFSSEIVSPTLNMTRSVADTSELFARAAKLLELTNLLGSAQSSLPTASRYISHPFVPASPAKPNRPHSDGRTLQESVRELMQTLLEEHPTLLPDADLTNLMDASYCRNALGLKLANLPLLRRLEHGRTVSGRDRFWAKPYADSYYVNSQWWKAHHLENARAMLRWIDDLMANNPHHAGLLALERCRAPLQDLLEAPAS